MLITVEEFRKLVGTDLSDELLKEKINALELAIRKYTNNNFQNRNIRSVGRLYGGGIVDLEKALPLAVGDTVMISNSKYTSGLQIVNYVIHNTYQLTLQGVNGINSTDENGVILTKVEYPADVVLGAVEILKWKLRNEAANSGDKSKKNIQSESISRYSVTYSEDSSEKDIDETFGVPKKYTAFLKEYQKARF